MPGTLEIVGTGMRLAGQVTPEALACMERADKLFYLDPESVTCAWLCSLNPTAETLSDSYGEGKNRADTYAEMVERILSPVRDGLRVCAAFYGHPGVFVRPSHEAVRRARQEGFEAKMYPGISSLDCLYADLGIDPGVSGCQIFEATDFVLFKRRFDARNKLILLQMGCVGVLGWKREALWSSEGVRILVEVLERTYPTNHEVTLYESFSLPVCDPLIQRIPLRGLTEAKITANSTLYIPPHELAEPDPEMLALLGIPPEAVRPLADLES